MTEKWATFHHPDFSWPVARRHISDAFVDLLFIAGRFMSSGGRPAIWDQYYPSDTAYRSAVSRLKKKGLLVSDARATDVRLSDQCIGRIPLSLKPERRWNHKWNGIWNLVVFDIDEENRHLRNILRKFFYRERIGNLQRSVWITPFDIRPLFDDLKKATAIDLYAYLFEARTVLGLPTERLVCDAWDFDLLTIHQSAFCRGCRDNIKRLEIMKNLDEIKGLIQAAMTEYSTLMDMDPLLPRELWPESYRGEEVVQWHQTLLNAAFRRL